MIPDNLLSIVVTLLPIAVIVMVILAQRGKRKRRIEAWKEAAMRLGFEHRENDPGFVEAHGIGRLRSGRASAASQVVKGRYGDWTIALAESLRRTGEGSTSSSQVVCILEQEGLDVPTFTLRPEMGVHAGGKLLGGLLERMVESATKMTDIDFDEDEEFSSRFHLSGPEEWRIRELFTPTVRRALLAHREGALGGFFLEAEGQKIQIISYQKLEPSELSTTLELFAGVGSTLRG